MKNSNDPIKLMYKALLGVSFVTSEYSLYPTAESALARARFLADEALRTMNTEHTEKVQKALCTTRRAERRAR